MPLSAVYSPDSLLSVPIVCIPFGIFNCNISKKDLLRDSIAIKLHLKFTLHYCIISCIFKCSMGQWFVCFFNNFDRVFAIVYVWWLLLKWFHLFCLNFNDKQRKTSRLPNETPIGIAMMEMPHKRNNKWIKNHFKSKTKRNAWTHQMKYVNNCRLAARGSTCMQKQFDSICIILVCLRFNFTCFKVIANFTVCSCRCGTPVQFDFFDDWKLKRFTNRAECDVNLPK